MSRYRVARYIYAHPWAILPEVLASIVDVVQRWSTGEKLSAEELEARVGPPKQGSSPSVSGAVAVLPLSGIIAHRAHMVNQESQERGTSTEEFSRAFRHALASPEVGSILLEVDSPGGSVDGVPELADEIYRARGQKPIVAIANTLMGSAAYWIASQADEIVAGPSSELGSIGVWTAHEDLSKRAEMMGVKITFISAGRHKTELNPFEPLGDEARAFEQAKVDAAYRMFATTVGRGRGVSVRAKDIEEGTFMGGGRSFGAKDAVAMGLADRVATFDETVARMASGRGRGRARAEELPSGSGGLVVPPVALTLHGDEAVIPLEAGGVEMIAEAVASHLAGESRAAEVERRRRRVRPL